MCSLLLLQAAIVPCHPASHQQWHRSERASEQATLARHGARSEWNGEKFGSYYMYIQQWHGVCQEKRTLVLA